MSPDDSMRAESVIGWCDTELIDPGSPGRRDTEFNQQPSEHRLAMSDSNMLEKFGVVKTIIIYKRCKKFIEIVKKWLKNYWTKKLVVEEIIKTEQTYIDGLTTMLSWRD